jgi:hypothetical protein
MCPNGRIKGGRCDQKGPNGWERRPDLEAEPGPASLTPVGKSLGVQWGPCVAQLLQSKGCEETHVRFWVLERTGQQVARDWQGEICDRVDRRTTHRLVTVRYGTHQRIVGETVVREPGLESRDRFHPHNRVRMVKHQRDQVIASDRRLSNFEGFDGRQATWIIVRNNGYGTNRANPNLA